MLQLLRITADFSEITLQECAVLRGESPLLGPARQSRVYRCSLRCTALLFLSTTAGNGELLPVNGLVKSSFPAQSWPPLPKRAGALTSSLKMGSKTARR